MKNPFKYLQWAKRPCPSCGILLRFPAHKGDLRITCPHCRQSFMIQFQRMSLFTWQKGSSRKENLLRNLAHWRKVWIQYPWMVTMWIVALVLLVFWIVRLITGNP